MQRALCSKPEEDTCAVCTNNVHRWILLYCSAGNAAMPRPVLQRSGRFDSDCKSPPPPTFELASVESPHRQYRRRSPTRFCLPVYALRYSSLPIDCPCACECFLPVAPSLFPSAVWTLILPLIFSIFVCSWNYYTELGKTQKQSGFRDVFSGSNGIHL